MHRSTHHNQYITGLSLIELMVALAVSAIMLLGVTTVYTASKRSYQINTEMAKIQENARFALHRLTKEIRMAGHTGCMNIDKANLINVLSSPASQPPGFRQVDPANPSVSFGVNTYVTGHTGVQGVYTPPFEVGLRPIGLGTGNIVPNSDAITIRSVSACSSAVVATNWTTLTVQGNCNFEVGDVVIVTNCAAADMFTISAIDLTNPNQPILTHAAGATLNSQARTTRSFKHANVFKTNAVVFYIGRDNIIPPNLGLYSMRLANQGGAYIGVARQLIPNIENMAITYGLDIDGDPRRSVDPIGNLFEHSAATVNGFNIQAIAAAAFEKEDRTSQNIPDTAWSRVVRTNIQLLLASNPVGTTIKPSIDFNGMSEPSVPDTRSRRVFSTTINIRARTP